LGSDHFLGGSLHKVVEIRAELRHLFRCYETRCGSGLGKLRRLRQACEKRLCRRQLILHRDELLLALNLPRVDAESHPISWRLDNKDTGRTLEGDKTLGENGVKAGHRLSLIRQVVAGGATV